MTCAPFGSCEPILGPINPVGFFVPFSIQVNVSTSNVISIYIVQLITIVCDK